jgi:hypothetical protein
MRSVLALAPRLHRSGGSTTTALAVVAFAVTTAFTLSVLGGLFAFVGRAEDPPPGFRAEDAGFYVILAATASVLLVIPLLTLGGAAARLGVARRDARLATLRLLGVTPGEVVALTVAETALQGFVGALAGTVGYAALLPVWTQLSFQGARLTAGELWVGLPALGGVLLGVPVLAAVSGTVSLRRVVVSPLGVARRQTPPGMKWVRVLAVVVAVGAFSAVTKVMAGLPAAVAIGMLLGLLAVVFATLNLMGPWTIGLTGRVMARFARRPATLLAARRLVDDPRAAWRVVGGLGLAAFVAGCLSVLPGLAASDAANDPQSRLAIRDIVTGGTVTLAISFAVAAVSAGIMQAASVLDRKREYALQQLAGVPVELFDQALRREVVAPLVLVAGTSAGVALLLSSMVLGAANATDFSGLILVVGMLVAGVVLMVAATETSRPLLRSVLRETVVRAD